MKLSHDVYSFELLKDGVEVKEVMLNSSYSYLQKLKDHGLITIDKGRIFLTDKGGAAKKIGFEKYLKLEEYERKVFKWNGSKKLRDLRFLRLVLLLVAVFGALLIYINWMLT